jgi:hypothetical protein
MSTPPAPSQVRTTTAIEVADRPDLEPVLVPDLTPVSPGNAPATAGTATWFIDANTVKSLNEQEKTDEVYLASVAFRTTPGKAGSTSVRFHGHLSEINDVDVGETHAIPDAMGRVTFANVALRGVSDVLAGNNPEVIGTISVLFESDLTAFSVINRLMEDVADSARAEIARVVETLSLADLTDGAAIAAQLSTAAKRIEASATPPLLRQIGILLGSLFNPDELVDVKINVFVAVDAELAPLVDAEIGQAIPAATGVGGALRPRSYSQTFSGEGGSYKVAYVVGK